MNTNIRVENNKVIFDGHASNTEQCNVITNICNALSSNDNFKTVKYEDGYAEFEIINQASDLKFASAPADLTLVFDDGIKSVSFYDRDGLKTVSTSGRTIETVCNDGQSYTFTIATKKMYKVISVVSGLDSGTISSYIDGSNQIFITAGVGGINGTITITTRKDKRIVQPKVKNADGSYDEIIFDRVNNADNSILKNDKTYGSWTENDSGVLNADGFIVSKKKLIWSGKLNKSNTTATLSETINYGDIYEIKYQQDNTAEYRTVQIKEYSVVDTLKYDIFEFNSVYCSNDNGFIIRSGAIRFDLGTKNVSLSHTWKTVYSASDKTLDGIEDSVFTIKEIYKVIQ